MRFETEVFYLKSDTDSGINGLVLQNRQQHHTGTSGIGLLHDLWEHSYKPIANPYLDNIKLTINYKFRTVKVEY